MKAAGRALRMIPPTPTYTVNRALGGWTDPGPVSAFAARDPIHIVLCTLRIKPSMFMFMRRSGTSISLGVDPCVVFALVSK